MYTTRRSETGNISQVHHMMDLVTGDVSDVHHMMVSDC